MRPAPASVAPPVYRPQPPVLRVAAPPVYPSPQPGTLQRKLPATGAPPVYRPEAPGTAQRKAIAPKAPPVYRPNLVQPRPIQSKGAIQRMSWTKSGEDIVPVDPTYKGPPRPPIPAYHKWEDGDVWDDQTGTIHRALKNLFANKAEAYNTHNEALIAEGGNAVIHGRSRHGYQTGVEGQLERASSKKTPDQPDDVLGVGATIREWTTSEGVKRMINEKGEAIDKSAHKPPKYAPKTRKSGGPYAGSFFSPDIQNRLIAGALVKAAPFLAWEEAEFETSGWVKIAFLDVVLQEQPGGYGIAFSNDKGTDTAYATRIVYEEGSNAPITTRPSVTTTSDDDERNTITYTPHGMDVYLMKCAKVQLRRKGAGWEVLSAFPENLAPGVAPIHKHGEELWTGKVRNTTAGTSGTLVVPAWPKKEK